MSDAAETALSSVALLPISNDPVSTVNVAPDDRVGISQVTKVELAVRFAIVTVVVVLGTSS